MDLKPFDGIMAHLEVKPKPPYPWWMWLLLLMVVAAIAIWLLSKYQHSDVAGKNIAKVIDTHPILIINSV
jgi:hypothetical protein